MTASPNAVFNDVCVLVTIAFALTLVPGFRQPERSLLSRRDQGTALLVFLVLGLVEEVTVSHAGCVARRLRIDSDMRPPRTLPSAHFERNDGTSI
jgi:hypothetical protein